MLFGIVLQLNQASLNHLPISRQPLSTDGNSHKQSLQHLVALGLHVQCLQCHPSKGMKFQSNRAAPPPLDLWIESCNLPRPHQLWPRWQGRRRPHPPKVPNEEYPHKRTLSAIATPRCQTPCNNFNVSYVLIGSLPRNIRNGNSSYHTKE